MRHPISLVGAGLVLASATGCATVAHGTRQTVTVLSNPTGANVTVLSESQTGQRIVKSTPGPTPVTLDLIRSDARIVIRLEYEGCPPAEVRLKRSVSGWIAGNLVFANPIAIQGYNSYQNIAAQYTRQVVMGVGGTMAIDFLSGAAYKLPKVIDVPLCGSPSR